MPIVYSQFSCLSSLGVFLLILLVITLPLITRTKFSKALVILPASLIAGVLTFFVWYPIASRISDKVQAKVAQPYIQQALDEQCGLHKFTADIDGFYSENLPWGDSGWSAATVMHWQSSDGLAKCSYSVVELDKWTCSC